MSNDLDLGSVTIDPRSDAYKYTKGVCEPGNPSKCLIHNMVQMHTGEQLRVHLNHDDLSKSYYSITYGDSVYKKPMPRADAEFARNFDLDKIQRKPLTVSLNLGDGSWTSEPKQTRSSPDRRKTKGDPTRQGSQGGVRARQLRNIRKNAQLVTA